MNTPNPFPTSNLNTSASGGYLVPVGLPLDDDALDAIFQGLVAGVTGLDGTLVRPRWQPTDPQQPATNTNWCAIGSPTCTPDWSAWMWFDPTSLTGMLKGHETIEILASFYGPNSSAYCKVLRDGLKINQNLEAISPIKYVESGPMRSVPSLVHQVWLKRQDMMITFRREVTRLYAVQTIETALLNIIDDTYGVNELVIVPPDAEVVGFPDASSDDLFASSADPSSTFSF